MASITLRIDKGSPLTNSELDDNFRQLNLLKVELGGDLGGATSAPVVTKLRGNAVSSLTPTTGQVLTWGGASWIPAANTTYFDYNSTTSDTSIASLTSSVGAFGQYWFSSSAIWYSALSVTVQSPGNGISTLGGFTEFEHFRFEGLGQVWLTSKQLNFSNAKYISFYYIAGDNNNGGGTPDSYDESLILQYNTTGNTWVTAETVRYGFVDGNDPNYAAATAFTWRSFVYDIPIVARTSSTRIRLLRPNSGATNDANYGVADVRIYTVNTQSSTLTVQSTQTILDDISNQFNNVQQIFTLRDDQVAIIEGVNYTDNKDFTVSIGGRNYRAAVPQTTTLGPWIVDYTAEPTYTYKVAGSRIIFYRGIENRQTAEIRINNRSVRRQKRKRYPFSANSIVLGD